MLFAQNGSSKSFFSSKYTLRNLQPFYLFHLTLTGLNFNNELVEGTLKTLEWKTREWKTREWKSRHQNAGVEIAFL